METARLSHPALFNQEALSGETSKVSSLIFNSFLSLSGVLEANKKTRFRLAHILQLAQFTTK